MVASLALNAALAVLSALTILTLVLPNYTVTTPGPQFSKPQLIYAGIASLVLMENAGRQVAGALEALVPDLADRRIAIAALTGGKSAGNVVERQRRRSGGHD